MMTRRGLKSRLALLLAFILVTLMGCQLLGEQGQTREADPSSYIQMPNLNQPNNEQTGGKPSDSNRSPTHADPLHGTAHKLTLAFAGDTMAAGRVAPILEEMGYQYPFQHVKGLFDQADLTMLNLETAVSLRGEAEEKQFAFRSHPDLVKGMAWAGVDIVTLANNHTLDYGHAALHDTFQYLQEYGIDYVGAGSNQNEAYSARVFEINGTRIAYLGFSRVLPTVDWYATENRPGLASGYQVDRMLSIVEDVKSESDLCIVYIHWGRELEDQPQEADRAIAYQLIDAGADLIIGAHPHVLQGMEWYNGKLIAYSLGNFIFTTSYQEVARQSGVLLVDIDLSSGEQHATFHPLKIEYGAVWDTDVDEREEILNRLRSLSKNGIWVNHRFEQQEQ